MYVKLCNAQREALSGPATILIYRQRDRKLAAEVALEASAAESFYFDSLEEHELYQVRVFPEKHRPAVRAARTEQRITIHCPVRPEAVRRIEIVGDVQAILRTPAELEDEELAGALNIWAKMRATRLGDGTAASFVKRITRINPDRIWFEPLPGMLDHVMAAASVRGDFRNVSGALHELRGYHTGRSFKTPDLYGNLQLTFMHRYDRPETLVEADIDEAGGITHAFEVLRNALMGKPTHPYDIHEILTFHQELALGYRLIV